MADPFSDTIAAPATPGGESALAVIRVSGPGARALAVDLHDGRPPPPRAAVHLDYRDATNDVVDDVVSTYFSAPRSYTGEDVLEISSHGNPYIVRRILDDLFNRGCRPAEPGEFTRRAFLNGRLDLSQAEAVMDLIRARGDRALEAARGQLRGVLGKRVASLIDSLVLLTARVEAYIDFPEEDLPPEDLAALRGGLETLETETSRLIATRRYGDLLRDGIPVVIAGETNAGKSSLLNRLVGFDRALVSDEPGTTRDFLEERVVIGAHCIRFLDTAGLNPSPAALERLGMEKTLERLADAALVLLVLDGSRPFPEWPDATRMLFDAGRTIVVLNKSDLGKGPPLPSWLAGSPIVSTCALTGDGLEDLVGSVEAFAESQRQDGGPELIAINARHAADLEEARRCLAEARAKLSSNAPAELFASDLRGALDALGRIGGKVDHERILDVIFATFCIGK